MTHTVERENCGKSSCPLVWCTHFSLVYFFVDLCFPFARRGKTQSKIKKTFAVLDLQRLPLSVLFWHRTFDACQQFQCCSKVWSNKLVGESFKFLFHKKPVCQNLWRTTPSRVCRYTVLVNASVHLSTIIKEAKLRTSRISSKYEHVKFRCRFRSYIKNSQGWKIFIFAPVCADGCGDWD